MENGQTFVFFGIVGSGKGTQVKLLQQFLEGKGVEVLYLGTGEIFRKIAASSDDNADTKVVKETILSGALVSDDMTNSVVWGTVETEFSSAKKLIFDGYPRTVNQSQVFEEKMKAYSQDIKVIFIELSEAEAAKRNLLRGRADDTEEGLKKRFEEYRNKVIPAMDYFKGKPGYAIYKINGDQSVEAVHQDIIKALNF